MRASSRTAQAAKWHGSPTCWRRSAPNRGCGSSACCWRRYPEGVVAGDIGAELGIAGSTLSHHLEKLRHEGLVTVRREGTFLRYAANAEALQALLAFLYAECCTRSRAVEPKQVVCNC